MIRRWSFIGFTNKSLYSFYKPLQHYLIDVNVNSVMYLRKVHSFFTRTRRRPWARRKHMYNWLISTSLLKFWATRYRTYRNTHKFLQNIFAMKTSFLTFGIYFKRSKLLQILQQSSEFVVSNTTKTLFRRNVSRMVWAKLPFLAYSSVAPLFVSSNSSSLSLATNSVFHLLGFFSFANNTLLSPTLAPLAISHQSLYTILLNQFFKLWLVNLKFLYRCCVLLLFFNLKLILPLKSKYTSSNGSRKRRLFNVSWYSHSVENKLFYRKISYGGRSTSTGKVVIYSKGSIKKRIKLLNISYSTRVSDILILGSVTFVPFVNKLVSFLVTDSGSYFYFPALSNARLFTLTSTVFRNRRYPRSLSWAFYSFIFALKTFKKISNLELTPNKGIQYARSSGSYAKMLTLNVAQHVALIKLPSGVKKYFSIYGIALSDLAALPNKKKLSIRQSGFFRLIGHKAQVRGVAKNPVDHPHGGRTKAIKYPRTPWGKTTKFK